MKAFLNLVVVLSAACSMGGCATENPLPQATEHYRLEATQVKAANAGATVTAGVKAALIKTGSQQTRQGLTIAGGSLFEPSLDWFGDASVVLVPLFGHTPGSVGLVLRTETGKRFMFVGDAIWNAKALQNGASKPWFVRDIADNHAGETLRSLQRILEFQASNPGLEIVPAHDASIHDRIGYFPEKWLP